MVPSLSPAESNPGPPVSARTGRRCVLLPEDRWWSFPPGRPFSEYLTVPLHNYFLGRTVVDSGGQWPFSEHAHGWHGVASFYEEKFGTGDEELVVRFLQVISVIEEWSLRALGRHMADDASAPGWRLTWSSLLLQCNQKACA